MDSIIGRIIATLLTLILIAGVGYIGYQGFQGSKSTTLATGVSMLVQTVQQDYTSYPTFAGLSQMPVNSLSQVKDLWGDSSGTIGTAGSLIDPWGDDMTVASGSNSICSSIAGVNSSDFCVEDAATNLGTTACKNLAMTVGSSAYTVAVGGTTVNSGGPGTAIDPVTVATACGSTTHPIVWVFGH